MTLKQVTSSTAALFFAIPGWISGGADLKQKFPASIRIACGVLGILGIAAIAFQAVRDGAIEPNLLLFSKLFAGFVFLWVAFFAAAPFDITLRDDDDKRQ